MNIILILTLALVVIILASSGEIKAIKEKTVKMKNLYWKRFISETPKVLKVLRNGLLAVGAGTGSLAASLIAFEKMAKYATVLGIISAICTGIAAGLQFATTDTGLQKKV